MNTTRALVAGTFLAGLALTGGVAVTSAVAHAAPTTPTSAACSLGANNPSSSSGTISGTGARSGCGGTVDLTVQVRKHRTAWPDKVVAETSRTGFSNGSLTALGSCDGNGTYFTETTSSSGNKISSGRVNRC